MPVKITICDDRKEDIDQLTSALYLYDPSFEITSFTSSQSLVYEILQENYSTDLLFLDIYMPELDGIKTAEQIRNQLKNLKIIFLSSSKDHYSQAYEVFAFNYILKPFNQERLYKVLDRALEEVRKENDNKIHIRYKGVIQSVDYRDILYIESQNKLLSYHLKDNNLLQCYGKLDDVLKELPEHSFFRCHQSFVVNLIQVTRMGENYFLLGQERISISRKYMKTAKEQYYACLFSRMSGGSLL